MAASSADRTVVGRVVATVVGLALMVLVAEGVSRLAFPQWSEFHSGRFMDFVHVPGYGTLKIGKPGFDGYFSQNNGDFRTQIRINAFGLRNPEPVESAHDQIWVVGDSMAFGWGVERDEAYAEVIERMIDRPVYSLAAPGNDVCDYRKMIARMPEGSGPVAVILGIILENDVKAYDCSAEYSREAAVPAPEAPRYSLSSLSGLKHELMRRSALYNLLAVTLKRVDVVKQGLVAIGLVSEEHAYRSAIPASAMNDLVERTASEIAGIRAMFAPETPFAVLVAPSRFEIKLGDTDHRRLRQSMVAALERQGIAIIDPYESFAAAGFEATHFTHDGHWSAQGHRLAAKAIVSWLKRHVSYVVRVEPIRAIP